MQKNVFEKLAVLQDSLKEKFALEDEIQSLPMNLRSKQEELVKSKKEFEELSEQAKANDMELKTLRFDYDNAVASHEKSMKQMEVITTQREFEALEKEISDADALEQSLLKQLHAKERQVEDLSELKTTKGEALDALESEVTTETNKIDVILKEKETQLSLLDATCKDSIDDDITEDLFNKFSSIVRNKEDEGIVAIHDNVCGGCHMVLPVQFVNDVRAMEKIEFCPYCSRILHYEEVEEVETNGLDAFTSDDDFDDIF